MWQSLVLQLRTHGRKPVFWFAVCAVIMGTWVRWVNLFHLGFKFDTTTTLYTWGAAAVDTGFYEFWQSYNDFFDYLPGSVYLLMVLTTIARLWDTDPGTFVIVLKAFNWLSELVLIGLSVYLIRLYGKGSWSRVISSAALVYLLPSLWFISAVWGQIDSPVMVSSLISVILFYQGITQKRLAWFWWSGAIWALAVWIKMQAVLLLPVFGLAYLGLRNWRMVGSHIFGGLSMTVLITIIPWLAHADRLKQNLLMPFEREPYVTRGGASIWPLLGVDGYSWEPLIGSISVSTIGNVLFGLFLLMTLFLVVSTPDTKLSLSTARQMIDKIVKFPFTLRGFLVFTTLLMLLYYLFTMKIYERYLHPATIFGIAAWTTLPAGKISRWWICSIVLMNVSHFLNLLQSYVWWGYTTPAWVVAVHNWLHFDIRQLSSLLNVLVLVSLLLWLIWIRFYRQEIHASFVRES